MQSKDSAKTVQRASIQAGLKVEDFSRITKKWTIRKYANQEDFDKGIMSEPPLIIPRNLLLNEGITALQNLLIGAAETAFSNANSYVGVGNSATAAGATDTGLLGASKFYQAVEATYPTITNQTTRWRAIITGANGNFAWEEITVANGNSDAADNLNRLVQAMGTKASPAIWTVDLDITWS